jgi:hypothetical protein
MRHAAILFVLAGGLAVGIGGCATIVWKGTEAATGAIQNTERPGQGPVLRGVQEGAGATHNAMARVDAAEAAALHKAESAFTGPHTAPPPSAPPPPPAYSSPPPGGYPEPPPPPPAESPPQ